MSDYHMLDSIYRMLSETPDSDNKNAINYRTLFAMEINRVSPSTCAFILGCLVLPEFPDYTPGQAISEIKLGIDSELTQYYWDSIFLLED